jgi:hypothetical protein
MGYRVVVGDNFRHGGLEQGCVKGEYATYAEALGVCMEIVDRFLRHEYVPGMPASALYFRYMMFGRDPIIVEHAGPVDPLPGFAGWDYAKLRCVEMCARASETPAA